jgi:hypothetical protein
MGVLRELIRYLCTARPQGFLRTELVKFVYLCDVESYRRFNRPITELQYEFGDHGPFNWGILDEATAMVGEGLLSYRAVPAPRRGQYGCVFEVSRSPVGEVGPRVLDSETLSVVRGVLERFSSLSLDELLDYVYTTPPTSLFRKGEVIDFGRWIPSTDLDYVTKSKVRKRLADLQRSARARLREEYTEYDLDGRQEEDDHADLVGALIPGIVDLIRREENLPTKAGGEADAC